MQYPETVYRGERTAAGEFAVTVNGRPFVVRRRLPGREVIHGVAWGQSGTGAKQLAHALVFDATGDAQLAAVSHTWVMWAIVVSWGQRWEISAGQVSQWVSQWRREARTLRLAARYEWAVAPVGWSPPARMPAVINGPPASDPVVRPAAGRVRLYPQPPADGLEGGGV